jgi:hypothetical protein
MKERMKELIDRENWGNLIYELRRQGHLDGPAIEVGAMVAVRILNEQVAVGRVAHVRGDYLYLSDSSWIDYTGEFYSETLFKGSSAEGWSSEYDGDVLIILGAGVKITFLPKSFILPTSAVRPNR